MTVKEILAAGSVALLLAACGTPDTENPTVTLKSYSYDCMAQYMEDENDTTSYTPMHVIGECVMPEAIGKRDITALRDTLASLALMDISAKHPTAKLPEGFRFTDKNIPPDVESYSASTVSVDLMTSRVIVWTASRAVYYHLAAHGSYSTRFVNYDLRDGTIITLSKLMKAGYEKPLLSLIKERLSMRDDIIVDMDDVQLPGEFCVMKDGIRFLYGLYEVAPYSSGEVSLDFSTYELSELLTDEAAEMIMTGQAD